MGQASLYDALLGVGNPLAYIQGAQFSPSNTIAPIRASGAIDPAGHSVTMSDPKSTLTSADLSNFLSILDPQAGSYLASDTINVPRNVRASGGEFASSGGAERLYGTKCLIVPRSISASQNGPQVTCNCEIWWLSSDGFTAPVASAGSFTLPTIVADADQYLLGAFSLDASQVVGLTNVTVDFGIQVTPIRTDGAIYAHDVFITQRDPTFALTFINTAVMQSMGPLFVSATSASCTFNKKSSGGTVAGSGNASVAFGNGIVDVQGLSGSGNDNLEATVTVVGRSMTVTP